MIKRLNEHKGMYALLIAVAAMIAITIYGSCSAEEDFDYYSGRELSTRADGVMGINSELPPTYMNCGKWALMQLGADGNIVQALIDSKLKDHDDKITNNLIYEIGQELLGFTVHKYGSETIDTLMHYQSDTVKLNRMIVYKSDFKVGHAGIVDVVTSTYVKIRDQTGTQEFYYSDCELGVMY